MKGKDYSTTSSVQHIFSLTICQGWHRVLCACLARSLLLMFSLCGKTVISSVPEEQKQGSLTSTEGGEFKDSSLEEVASGLDCEG